MPRKLIKIISFVLCFLMLFQQSGFAQVAEQVNIAGYITQLRNALTVDKFRPLHLRYLSYDHLNNKFKLLLDKGDLKGLNKPQVEKTTQELLKYFFIGVSLPNEAFWVNLRPDAEGNIIDANLAKTDLGKVLLEADLQLKKDTAKFTSPETVEGKKYWDKLYQKAAQIFGSSNITIPTLTRPWIVPDEIIIRETAENAYIYKATLKVMLEQDYLKESAVYNFKDDRLKELNQYSSQLIRELIIPKLTKEINSSKRYAGLRQVYYSLILAQWFKARFYGKGGLYSWLINKQSLNGLTSKEPWSKTTYFQGYQKSFQQGEYNFKEPVSTPFGQTIRSYFSGGIALGGTNMPNAPAVGAVTNSGAVSCIGAKPGEVNRDNPHILAVGIPGGNTNDLAAAGAVDVGEIKEEASAATPEAPQAAITFLQEQDQPNKAALDHAQEQQSSSNKKSFFKEFFSPLFFSFLILFSPSSFGQDRGGNLLNFPAATQLEDKADKDKKEMDKYGKEYLEKLYRDIKEGGQVTRDAVMGMDDLERKYGGVFQFLVNAWQNNSPEARSAIEKILSEMWHGEKIYETAAFRSGSLETKQMVIRVLIRRLCNYSLWNWSNLDAIPALKAIGAIDTPEAREALLRVLNEPSMVWRQSVIETLGDLKEPRAIEPLVKICKQAKDSGLYAASALGRIGSAEAMAHLDKLSKDQDPRIWLPAAAVLAKGGSEEAEERLIQFTKDGAEAFRRKHNELFNKDDDAPEMLDHLKKNFSYADIYLEHLPRALACAENSRATKPFLDLLDSISLCNEVTSRTYHSLPWIRGDDDILVESLGNFADRDALPFLNDELSYSVEHQWRYSQELIEEAIAKINQRYPPAFYERIDPIYLIAVPLAITLTFLVRKFWHSIAISYYRLKLKLFYLWLYPKQMAQRVIQQIGLWLEEIKMERYRRRLLHRAFNNESVNSVWGEFFAREFKNIGKNPIKINISGPVNEEKAVEASIIIMKAFRYITRDYVQLMGKSPEMIEFNIIDDPTKPGGLCPWESNLPLEINIFGLDLAKYRNKGALMELSEVMRHEIFHRLDLLDLFTFPEWLLLIKQAGFTGFISAGKFVSLDEIFPLLGAVYGQDAPRIDQNLAPDFIATPKGFMTASRYLAEIRRDMNRNNYFIWVREVARGKYLVLNPYYSRTPDFDRKTLRENNIEIRLAGRDSYRYTTPGEYFAEFAREYFEKGADREAIAAQWPGGELFSKLINRVLSSYGSIRNLSESRLESQIIQKKLTPIRETDKNTGLTILKSLGLALTGLALFHGVTQAASIDAGTAQSAWEWIRILIENPSVIFSFSLAATVLFAKALNGGQDGAMQGQDGNEAGAEEKIRELITTIQTAQDIQVRADLARTLGQALANNPALLEPVITAIQRAQSNLARSDLAVALGRAIANNPVLLEPVITAVKTTQSDSTRGCLLLALDCALDYALDNNKGLRLMPEQLGYFIAELDNSRGPHAFTTELLSVIRRALENTQGNPAHTAGLVDFLSDQTQDLDRRKVAFEIFNRHIYTGHIVFNRELLIKMSKLPDEEFRKRAYNDAIEPLFFKSPELFDDEVLSCWQALVEEIPEAKYILFYKKMHETGPTNNPTLFPHQEAFRKLMAKGKKRVLIMHNLKDGMGDELIRNATLMQAFLSYNPEIEIVLYTGRPFPYSHPRVEVRGIQNYVPSDEQFDMVVHHFDRGQNYSHEIEDKFQSYLSKNEIKSRHNVIYINTDKANDQFTAREIILAGKEIKLPYYAGNVYIPIFRLCAELGLPFRYGTQKREEDIFTSVRSTNRNRDSAQDVSEKDIQEAAARNFSEVILSRKGNRQAVIFNGFGGESESKGIPNTPQGHAEFREAVKKIIQQGYFVIILPNHQPWGTVEVAMEIITPLYRTERGNVIIALSPVAAPLLHKYLVVGADRTITVEGGLNHLAYNMGKPTITLPMRGSGSLNKWLPAGADSSQFVAASHQLKESIGRDRVRGSSSITTSQAENATHANPALGMGGAEVDFTGGPASGFVDAEMLAGMIRDGNIEGAVRVITEARQGIFKTPEEERDYLKDVQNALNGQALWQQFTDKLPLADAPMEGKQDEAIIQDLADKLNQGDVKAAAGILRQHKDITLEDIIPHLTDDGINHYTSAVILAEEPEEGDQAPFSWDALKTIVVPRTAGQIAHDMIAQGTSELRPRVEEESSVSISRLARTRNWLLNQLKPIKADLQILFKQNNIIAADETELNKLALRIYDAQQDAAGRAVVQVIDTVGIDIPGLKEISPRVLGIMGMGGVRPGEIDASTGSSSIPQEGKPKGSGDTSQKAPSINPSEKQGPGGIDFRALPIVTQPMQPGLGTVPLRYDGIHPALSDGPVPRLLRGVPVTANLDKEWLQIQNMLQAGIIPSSERIREYLESCCKNGGVAKELDKVLSCIADILRMEEERCAGTEPALKQLLVLLESDKPLSEFQQAVAKISVAPKQPKAIGK